MNSSSFLSTTIPYKAGKHAHGWLDSYLSPPHCLQYHAEKF